MLRNLSTFFLRTLREDPADAEVNSHKLLVRAGYIRRSAPGIYTWLPLGLRTLRKIEDIVREEMDSMGAQRAQAEGQPRVDAGRSAADVSGTHQKLVRVDLGVGRVLTQGSQEESREISKHAPRVRHVKALGPPAQPCSPLSTRLRGSQITARAPSSRSRAPGWDA